MSRILVTFIILSIGTASGANIIVNGYMASTTGASGNDANASSPADPASATSALTNNLGASTATASALNLTNPNGDLSSFQFSNTNFASASVDRTNGSGNVNTTGSATAEYTIEFNLGVNETGFITFNLDFSIDTSSNQTAGVSWTLSGPDPNTSAISGSSTTAAINASSGIQTATLNTAGNYTLTMIAEVPDQDFGSNKSASVTLNDLNFTLISIPEPSSTFTLSISLIALIWYRRPSYRL